jgi:hypothetical protein
MTILDSITGFLSGYPKQPDILAGNGQLPPVDVPKPPTKPVALPSFKTQVAKSTSVLQQKERNLANTSIGDYRTGQTTYITIRDLAVGSPDLAATLAAYLRVGISEKYTVVARDMDGALNVKATQLAQEILRRITFLGDVSLGYNPVTDLQSLSESLGKELLLYGSAALELALDKAKSPLYLNPVSVTKIKYKEEDGGVYPVQVVGGQEISLDIATFFIVNLDQDLLTPYSSSYFESAIQSVLADSQFLDDLRRSMQRVIQPRLTATIIEEKVKASAPPDILNDPEKLTAFYNTLITDIQTLLTGLATDEALVSFDAVEYGLLNSQGPTGSVADTLKAVQGLLESKLTAGAKSLPAVLGRDSTGNGATTSSMLFLKNADIVRKKLNTLYSRALTQAVRLMAEDCYVEFRYADLDLRPQAELEAYRSMEFSRITDLLSIGFITDEEACIQLTGNLPPPGFKPLSGTMYKTSKAAEPAANPDSQTSNMKKSGAAPDTPAAPKGPAKP